MRILLIIFIGCLLFISCQPLTSLRNHDQFKQIDYHKSGDTVDYHRVFYPPSVVSLHPD